MKRSDATGSCDGYPQAGFAHLFTALTVPGLRSYGGGIRKGGDTHAAIATPPAIRSREPSKMDCLIRTVLDGKRWALPHV